MLADNGLIAKGQGFRHSQVERKLDEAEAVFLSGNFLSNRFHLGELDRVARPRVLPEAVPRRHAVVLNLSGLRGRFQVGEGIADSFGKFRLRNFAELRFRIMQVIDVHAFDTKIP